MHTWFYTSFLARHITRKQVGHQVPLTTSISLFTMHEWVLLVVENSICRKCYNEIKELFSV